MRRYLVLAAVLMVATVGVQIMSYLQSVPTTVQERTDQATGMKIRVLQIPSGQYVITGEVPLRLSEERIVRDVQVIDRTTGMVAFASTDRGAWRTEPLGSYEQYEVLIGEFGHCHLEKRVGRVALGA